MEVPVCFRKVSYLSILAPITGMAMMLLLKEGKKNMRKRPADTKVRGGRRAGPVDT